MSRDEKLAYYPWYPRSFAADEPVIAMTLPAEGAYRRLLDHQWLHGSVPADLTLIARICKNEPVASMRRLWAQIAPCFTPDPDDPSRLRNAKLERVRAETLARRDRRSAAGRAGAAGLWQSHDNANGKAMAIASKSHGIQKTDTDTKTKTEVVVDVAAAARTVTAALNRGLQENPRIGSRFNPVIATSGTQTVQDWLRDGIPEGFATETVYRIAKGFTGDGQISSLNYCDRGVRKAWARSQAHTDAGSAKPAAPLLPRISA